MLQNTEVSYVFSFVFLYFLKCKVYFAGLSFTPYFITNLKNSFLIWNMKTTRTGRDNRYDIACKKLQSFDIYVHMEICTEMHIES